MARLTRQLLAADDHGERDFELLKTLALKGF
jgi:hypothetical protein